jgi:hypothetical protein
MIWAVGQYLVSPEFCFGETTRNEYGSLFRIDFDGVLVSLLYGKAEQPLQHLNHVVIAVVIIVQQDDVIERRRLVLILALLTNFRYGYSLRHSQNLGFVKIPMGHQPNDRARQELT